MDSITIAVTDDEIGVIRRADKEGGGFQALFGRLEAGISGNQLTLTRTDAQRVMRYAEDYGGGGWQQHLGPLADRIREAL